MKLRLPSINRTQLLSYSLFFFSACILFASFLLTQNVKVLVDWTLSVPSEPIHVGDTVVIKSEYTKLKDVSGTATRYIECETNRGLWIRYPLNEAVANRSSGTGGTGIVVKVPETIPDVPTSCKFTIAILYEVYPWKKVSHTNSSNIFTLREPREEPAIVGARTPETQTQTSPALGTASVTGLSLVSNQYLSSLMNTTPTISEAQPNTSQGVYLIQ